jgi:hypothetical protein
MKPTLISLLGLLSAGLCQADTIYDISLNTSALQGNANGPFALDFQLTSGDTTSGILNIASLSQFSFGNSGSAGAGQPFSNSGNASGSLASTVSLSTSGGTFFNEFSQNFVPGNTLSFQLDLSNHPQSGPTPDEFTFQLIDGTTSEVTTTDPSGSNSLIVVDLNGATVVPQIYTTTSDGVSISPVVTSAAPEPGTCLLLSAVIIIAAIKRWKNEKEAH